MSENQQGADGAGQSTQTAIDAWTQAVVSSISQGDQISVPLLQAYLDTRLVQVKLEALFEELDAEHMVDSSKVMARFLRKLDLERRQAQQAIEARPRVQPVQGAVAQAINGKKVRE